jgi:hypothetical protein
MKKRYLLIVKSLLFSFFLLINMSKTYAIDSDDGLLSFLPDFSSLWRSLTHNIFRFPRLVWYRIVGFVALNKVIIGWGLVIIVPVVGLVILFMYLANRPKASPPPYIQTNHPRSQPEEQFAGTILYVTHANGFRENISMIYDRMIIGTNPRCQIILQDVGVADQHAEIYTTEGRYFVRDLGSGYGTYVNGVLITDITELFSSYYVQMGGSTIQL